MLHDTGKLHVPATLLNSPDNPTPEEWEILRQHPEASARLAAPLLEWLAPMDLVIQEHHERWDGSGYPTGLGLGARIIQVAASLRSPPRPGRTSGRCA